MQLQAFVFLTTITTCVGYQQFMNRIPNGNQIPHPCDSTRLWSGVGHLQPGGQGERNPFGVDFKNNNMTWTRSLCMADSDGDGRTNGEELGDPTCTWKVGAPPTLSSGLSHPGVCQPLDSPTCVEKNKQFGSRLECNELAESCDAITEPGVLKMDLRFPKTPIPDLETNYHCMLYDLPSGGDYHIVATAPIINNTAIVHHIIMFGCEIPESLTAKSGSLKVKPYKCGMYAHKNCQQVIGTWTVGSDGDCVSRESGFRAGRNGYKVVALQIHWNNPDRLKDQTDSSGLSIYYTEDRRPYDAAIFMVGQEFLMMPPNTREITFDANCPSDCTREMFNESIYVTRAVNHMHYYGKSQVVSLYRDGKKLRDFTNDQEYSYDSPKFYHFDPPIEVKPGDEIRTQCVYRSIGEKFVTYGAGTSDEMCYGFLTYYPMYNITPTFCASWKSVQRCRRYLPKFEGMIGDCEWRKYLNAENPETQRIYTEFYALGSCGEYAKTRKCNENCTRVATRLLGDPCLQGDIGDWVKHKLDQVPKGWLMLNALRDCGIANGSTSLKCLPHELFVVYIILFLVRLTVS